MKPEIIPAILAKSADEAQAKIRAVEGIAHWIQWDVMDGKFVPNETWYDARIVRRWKIKPKIELHLMVNDPLRVIRAWRSVPGMRRVIWHLEAPVDHEKLIRLCRRWKLEVGLAINPGTPAVALVPYLRKLDAVLVMGVRPGWSGQKLQRSTLQKTTQIRRLVRRLPIGFDGGVTARALPSLLKAGATRLCVASAIYKTKNPRATLTRLQKRLKAV